MCYIMMAACLCVLKTEKKALKTKGQFKKEHGVRERYREEALRKQHIRG